MKFVTYLSGGQHVGCVDDNDDGIVSLTPLLGPGASLLEVVERWEAVQAFVSGHPAPTHRVDDVEILAPIPTPRRNIICIGKNYLDHVKEFEESGFDSTMSSTPADKPVFFTKAPSTVISHGAAIELHDHLTTKVDYEAELAVVIGKGGRGISTDEAMSHVWGYTILNDVTARDLQKDHQQWFLGKSLDGFCPMGPFAVSADELDLGDTRITSRVNGEPRQDSNTRFLIYDVPALISWISAGITLQPGDIIATGTPSGVGIGFDPPKFLQPGDSVEVAIEGLGVLRNSYGSPN